ncbi:hypothetical protein ABW21_db0207291 [Orbilia brochopaga]|nr:hypothetical protein ABW21_db0207291 [Drechslerella brochopaga]
MSHKVSHAEPQTKMPAQSAVAMVGESLEPKTKKEPIHAGSIVLTVIFGLIFLVAVITILWHCYRVKMRPKRRQRAIQLQLLTGNQLTGPNSSTTSAVATHSSQTLPININPPAPAPASYSSPYVNGFADPNTPFVNPTTHTAQFLDQTSYLFKPNGFFNGTRDADGSYVGGNPPSSYIAPGLTMMAFGPYNDTQNMDEETPTNGITGSRYVTPFPELRPAPEHFLWYHRFLASESKKRSEEAAATATTATEAQ